MLLLLGCNPTTCFFVVVSNVRSCGRALAKARPFACAVAINLWRLMLRWGACSPPPSAEAHMPFRLWQVLTMPPPCVVNLLADCRRLGSQTRPCRKSPHQEPVSPGCDARHHLSLRRHLRHRQAPPAALPGRSRSSASALAHRGVLSCEGGQRVFSQLSFSRSADARILQMQLPLLEKGQALPFMWRCQLMEDRCLCCKCRFRCSRWGSGVWSLEGW